MPLCGKEVVKRGYYVFLIMFVSGMSEPLHASLSRWLFTWRCPMRGLPSLAASAASNPCKHTRARTHCQGPLMCSPPPQGAPLSPVAQREQQGAKEPRRQEPIKEKLAQQLNVMLRCCLSHLGAVSSSRLAQLLHQSTHLPSA